MIHSDQYNSNGWFHHHLGINTLTSVIITLTSIHRNITNPATTDLLFSFWGFWDSFLLLGDVSCSIFLYFLTMENHVTHMGVSENRGTPKSSQFNRVFHYKPIHFGVPLFLKTPIWAREKIPTYI